MSIDHVDAETYFNRDVAGIRAFFEKKFRYVPENDPIMLDTDGYGEGYKHAYPSFTRDVKRINSLDLEVKASGYAKANLKESKDLEFAVESMRMLDEDRFEEDESEDGYGSTTESEDDYDGYELESDDAEFEQEEEKLKEENEKIVDALSLGVKELKMDKLGNYILD